MSKNNKHARLEVVDALRGFALMALFLIHMVEYFELYWYQPEPGLVHDVMFFLFAGKAYAIFALLFGVSFFIQMENQAQKGIDFRARFAWRLTLLFIMGYLHGLLYSGDILQVLAVCGLLLLLVYQQSNKIILILALVFLLQIPLIAQLILALIDSSMVNSQPWHWSLMSENFQVYANGSFKQLLATNSVNGQFAKWVFFIEAGRIYTVLGLFLIGLFIARKHYFSKITQLKRQMFIGLVITILSALLWYFCSSFNQVFGQLFELTGISLWMFNTIVGSYLNLSLTLAGVLLFCLLYQLPDFARSLNLLAPCGRMSLTLYVAQSLIGIPLFYGFAVGGFQTFGQVNSLLLGFVLWSVQMFFAHLWLKQYKYGPLEWCWRCFTQGKKIENLRIESKVLAQKI
ncbi:MAG: DUF418 domain-containing protein [Colwellia sp.]